MTVSHDISSLAKRYTSTNSIVIADTEETRILPIVLLNVRHELPPLMASEVTSNRPTSMVVGEIGKPRPFSFGDHDGVEVLLRESLPNVR